MAYARSGTHILNAACSYHRAVAKCVLVFQCAFNYIRKDFCVLMWMLAKTFAAFHLVVINDP